MAEANIVLGIHAHATSLITIAKLKKHFSKTETRAIAREVCVSALDISTYNLNTPGKNQIAEYKIVK